MDDKNNRLEEKSFCNYTRLAKWAVKSYIMDCKKNQHKNLSSLSWDPISSLAIACRTETFCALIIFAKSPKFKS